MSGRLDPVLVRRTCPACSRRTNQIAAGDCPICKGDGFLVLGKPALRRWHVEVVSRAVEYSLEEQAGKDLAARVPLSEARRNLTVMVQRLVAGGFLAQRGRGQGDGDVPVSPDVSSRTIRREARALSEAASGLQYHEGTDAVLQMPPIEYEPSNVEVDGKLPRFSKAGFLCNLARVADPIEVLSVSPPGRADQASIDRMGEVLGRAIS